MKERLEKRFATQQNIIRAHMKALLSMEGYKNERTIRLCQCSYSFTEKTFYFARLSQKKQQERKSLFHLIRRGRNATFKLGLTLL